MEFRTLILSFIVFGMLGQFVLLALQLHALRRTGHYSLRLLCYTTVLGMAALTTELVSYVFDFGVSTVWRLAILEVVFGVTQIVLGLWAIAALFRSYIGLYESARKEQGRLA